ncbi:uncharacterized protein LOC131009273 [Salvia miltiorrhiza]|uniref:uncharacterized protein LOC131009273 n=1 Tax=Salvia miltiorrhiza TaxID=226208 RepID=UPI0025ABAABC|nr:uncharacterized protein LOC131009273 [Salvia miltiorrhiza]
MNQPHMSWNLTNFPKILTSPMENIQHSFVNIRGLKLHIAEIGTGPAVVFLHGFPEIWYSWRHQMTAVADAGFRAIAPDFRGYGLSQQPPEPTKTTFKDMVDDLVAMLDLLGIPKVILVGKDFGAKVVYHFALVHPKRVSAVATLGVPFVVPTDPETFKASLPKGFYVLRFREEGRAEKDFGRFDAKTVFKKIYIMFTASELQVASEDQEIMDLVDESAPLPAWFTEEDLRVYGELYEKSGYQTALQVPYRAWLEGYGVDELRVEAPGLLIMGEEDYALKFAGFDHYIKSGMVKKHVPDLEVIFVPHGTHFVQEQFPDQVNNILIKFLNKHASSN